MSDEHAFDQDYWEGHWEQRPGGRTGPAANPYLARELGDLAPGTALDAGCGEGAEAVWLAEAGWQVTAADISVEALERAAARAEGTPATGRIEWVRADLGTWAPGAAYDLVTTHYAHPTIGQLAFYERIAGWVRPGGTLLVVGHRVGHGDDHGHGHDGDHPAEASATAAGITGLLHPDRWEVVTADEPERTVAHGGGSQVLRDVVVRAVRRT